VVTFDQHPARVTSPENAPKLLTSFEQKLELFESLEIDYVYLVRFTKERSMTSASSFYSSVFVDGVKAKTIIVGEDFQFGHNREGNLDLLKVEGAKTGVEVIGMKLVEETGTPVSSTAIRNYLATGDILSATNMLGRFFEVEGTVVKGAQRGQQIGFPTANITVSKEMLLPSDGVYACWYMRDDGHRHMAAANIGRRPTFQENNEESILEVHLIGYEGNLYGEKARVEFVDFLRNEIKFENLDALRNQLEADIAAAHSLLDDHEQC
jgi:riboflavin kinase/FMN adenylyltransferase